MKLSKILISVLILSGCTDAGMSKVFSLGSQAHVVCRSGGNIFLDTYSTGKVFSEKTSDGYYFTEKDSGDLIEVNGDCLIRYKK